MNTLEKLKEEFASVGTRLNALSWDRIESAIESHTAAHTAALRERVKELEAKIASYESSIDGLKKVVDSLYNLKS